MKKPTLVPRKLVLGTLTLRTLDTARLADIVGGQGVVRNSKPAVCSTWATSTSPQPF